MDNNPIYARKPVITYLLIAANVLLWLLETVAGGSDNIDVAMKFGALYTPYVMQYGQWWRLITSMFLHFGIDHLASNMISLGAIGPYAEWYYGRAGMLVLYFAGGISGNLLTIAVENRSGDYGISAGASGAIFGLVSIFIIFLRLSHIEALLRSEIFRIFFADELIDLRSKVKIGNRKSEIVDQDSVFRILSYLDFALEDIICKSNLLIAVEILESLGTDHVGYDHVIELEIALHESSHVNGKDRASGLIDRRITEITLGICD